MRLIAALICATVALAPARVQAASAADDADSIELNPQIEAAIGRGLAYLASQQRRDGSWPHQYGDSPGIVAACCIAFMASGNYPGHGKYGVQVARGIQWLLRNTRKDGLIYPGQGNTPGHVMYHHGLALLALSEAWGMTQDPEIRDAVKRATDLTVRCQSMDGGWRYQPRIEQSSDVSAAVMQIMALRSAYEAGIYVPKETIDRGIAYVKRCHNPAPGKDGGFAYQPGGDSGFHRTGAGVLSLLAAGNYRSREVVQGIDYLMKHKPVGDKDVDHQGWYFYGHYYAAMAIYQSQSLGEWGHRAWRSWYSGMTREIIGQQRGDGSWAARHGQYETAMAILILSIPYRYLPIYQR